jgi:capsular polysaccharide biosynthesis protein
MKSSFSACVTPRAAAIEDGRLVGKDALGFTNDDRVLLNTTRNDRKKLHQRIYNASIYNNVCFLKPSLFPADERYSSLFPLVGDPDNYYVWLLEYLPKLRALKTYTEETGRKPVLLIRSNPPSFMTESLEYFDFDRYEIVELDADVVHADRLIGGTPHRRHNVRGKYQPHLTGYEWLREKVEQRVDREQSLDRIYVSRHDMENRRANNEEEIVDALEKRGFTKVKPSEITFEQQVQYFSDPEMIVGVHGSGFTNMMWSADPTIVEVLPPNKHKNSGCYCMTRLLGFEYDFLFCSGGEKGVDVDVSELCKVVDSYLED